MPLTALFLSAASLNCDDYFTDPDAALPTVPVVMKRRVSKAQSGLPGSPPTSAKVSQKPSRPSDLLSLLENVRALHYESSRAFCQDLNALRGALVDKLAEQQCAPQGSTCRSLLSAFDTLLDAAFLFLRSKELVLSCSEEALSAEDFGSAEKRNAEEAEVVQRKSVRAQAASSSSSVVSGDSAEGVKKRGRAAVGGSLRHFEVDCSRSAEQVMLSLWRRECDRIAGPRIASSSAGPVATSVNGATVEVTARSLLAWAHFVDGGEIAPEFRGRGPDPFGLAQRITLNGAATSGAVAHAKQTVQRLLTENADFSHLMVSSICSTCMVLMVAQDNNLHAAHVMLGMKSSGSRETVSLLENAWTITDRGAGAGEAEGAVAETRIADETLVLLSRLRESAALTQQLEASPPLISDSWSDLACRRGCGKTICAGSAVCWAGTRRCSAWARRACCAS